MNLFLWIVQGVLAFLTVSGGAFKIFAFDQLAQAPWYGSLPRSGWSAVGVFEVVCGVLLIVPAATGRMPGLTPLAAGTLAIEALALAALYGKYSRELAATNPLVWVLAAAAMAIVVVLGRWPRG